MATTNSDFRVKNGLITGSTIVAPASTTTVPSLRIPHGSAPTTPTNGDFWTTTAGVYARINGTTVGPFGAGSTGTLYTFSASAPSSPNAGDQWQDSNTMLLYTYINDGSSSQWVDVRAPGISSGGVTIGSSTPQALGTASAGSSGNASADDHVHPTTELGVLSAANVFTNVQEIDALASGIGLILKANATTPGNTLESRNSGGTVLASISAAGNITAPQHVANLDVSGSLTQGAFAYGTLSYSDTNHFLSLQTSVNSYAQMEIQNTNAGTTASADIIVGNNNTTATTYYGDFGINSSGFTGSGSLKLPNAVYLSSTTGELVLGTTTANGIRFVTNSAATDALAISSTGTATFTGQVNLAAGTTTLAPLVFSSGSKLTSPTTGAMEFEVDELYMTTSSTTGRGIIPVKHMIVNQANSTAATTTTPQSPFAAGNDVLSSLEANRLYRFRGRYKFTSTFTSGTANVQILFAFSNAPAAINYDFRTFVLTPNTIVLANTRVGTVTVTTATQVTPAIAATISYVVDFEGWIKSHATLTSTLTPQFQMSTTGSSTVVTPYSFFEIEKIGGAADTLIAGNWA